MIAVAYLRGGEKASENKSGRGDYASLGPNFQRDRVRLR